MSEKTKQQRASHNQAIIIHDLLRKVCKTVDTLAVYSEGWSDERVAEELGLGLNSVQNRRNEEYGALRTHRRRDAEAAQVDTIKNMSYMLANAIGEIQDLRRRVDALEKARGGNFQQFLPLQAMGK